MVHASEEGAVQQVIGVCKLARGKGEQCVYLGLGCSFGFGFGKFGQCPENGPWTFMGLNWAKIIKDKQTTQNKIKYDTINKNNKSSHDNN